jgi:hypothetical protein
MGRRQPVEILGRTLDNTAKATAICKLAAVEFMARHSRLAAVVWSDNRTSDLLLSLTQLNSWRAMMQNMNALGMTMATVKQEDAVSRFRLHDTADMHDPLPPALRPTSLQRALVHHPWIDSFPFPDFRDLLLLREGEYSEEALCNDLCGSSTDQNSTGQVGMITWGEPWDPSSWEMTEDFARKWLWMFSTCSDLLAATNHWRIQRGEVELFGWLSGIPSMKEGCPQKSAEIKYLASISKPVFRSPPNAAMLTPRHRCPCQ